MAEHKTAIDDEGTLVKDGPDAVEKAHELHHLATADPEFDGKMTGPAHEKFYGLERAADSAALWESAGVHPIKNGALDLGPAEPKNSGSAPAKKQ